MKFINKTRNSVQLEDIDLSIEYANEEPQYIDTELVKKSIAFQKMVKLGCFSVIEATEDRIEQNLYKLSKTAVMQEPPVVERKPSGLSTEAILRGHFYDATGYSKVNRNFAMCLRRSGIAVEIDPVTTRNNTLNEVEAMIFSILKKPVGKDAIRIDSVIPTQGKIEKGCYNILYTTTESRVVPKQFVDIANDYDELWVTSNFCKQSFLNSGYSGKVSVVHPIVNPNLYKEDVQPYTFRPSLKSFSFVSVQSWGYRKGSDVLLRAFCSAFTNKDDVSLVVLTSERSRAQQDKIRKEVETITGEFSNKPHICICTKIVPEYQLPSFYKGFNAFVLPSRGEGFGLPYCFKEGTLIDTQDGLQPIECISEGQIVTTHLGKQRVVTSLKHSEWDGEILEIEHGFFANKIEVTPNHAFWCVQPERGKNGKFLKKWSKPSCWKPEWVRAENINNNSYLAHPIRKEWPVEYISLCVSDFCQGMETDGQYLWSKYSSDSKRNEINELVELSGCSRRQIEHYRYDGKLSEKASIAIAEAESYVFCGKKKIPNHILINEKFAKLLGYYIAEGSIFSKGNAIEFSLHANENDYAQEIKEAIHSIFGVGATDLIKNNSRRIIVNSKILASLFSNLCGMGSSDKKIPLEIIKSPKSVQQSFLNGIINGDGHSNSYNNEVTLFTVSKSLAINYQKMMLDLGEPCTLRVSKRNEYICKISGCNNCRTWIEKDIRIIKSKQTSIIKVTKDYIFVPIVSVSRARYVGKVFNFEVEEDESYIAGGVAVHNCEASLCGLPIIATNYSGCLDFLTKDNSYLVDFKEFEQAKKGSTGIHYWDGQEFPKLDQFFIHDLADSMRHVFNNYDEAKVKNALLQDFIKQNLDGRLVGLETKSVLNDIWTKRK